MKVIDSIEKWQALFRKQMLAGRSIGLVPTMGALHKGHLSLVARAVEENDISAVTIFVNPTQFTNSDDLQHYPDTREVDLQLLHAQHVDYVLLPDYNQLYPDCYRYRVVESELTTTLCGASRPGHFDGVLTVVLKLLHISYATRAYFGEKDWQQYRLIAGMAEAFFLDTEIIACPLVREESGLALSSRNLRLRKKERCIAPLFHQALSSGKSLEAIREQLVTDGFVVDYLSVMEGRLFGAVFLGDVRLIDNVELPEAQNSSLL